MPRVLFNMPSQYAGRPSGVARMALELLDNLVGQGDFEYVLRSPWTRAQLPESLRAKQLSVITIERSNSRGLDVLRQTLTFPLFCRREKIDLVVNLDPFGAASGGRARMVIVHDIYFRTIPKQIGRRAIRTNDFILKLMLFGNSEVVTVSEATKTDLELWYPQAKGRVTAIHSATSLKPAASSEKVREIAGPYVLAVGNATENKNYGVLAEAMAKIHSLLPDVAFVHVGDDDSEIIATTLKSLGSSLRLVRLKGIDDARLARLYAHASCLCVPSLYEGFCLPVLEAQVCGCPVVCSNQSATPEIAGQGALLFDPTDSVALVECLRGILTDKEASQRLTKLGYKNAERFSWALAAAQYQKVFERLLAGDR
jgi:glycosyltransferase involved in cell wall biosynthesis